MHQDFCSGSESWCLKRVGIEPCGFTELNIWQVLKPRYKRHASSLALFSGSWHHRDDYHQDSRVCGGWSSFGGFIYQWCLDSHWMDDQHPIYHIYPCFDHGSHGHCRFDPICSVWDVTPANSVGNNLERWFLDISFKLWRDWHSAE